MAKINDTTTYPNTTPALTDHVIGTDVSDTGNSANGEVVTFLLGDIVKLGGFKGLQVFTSSGTWNRPTGVNSVLMFVTGGGGGGTGSFNGASGATAIKRLDVTGVSTATITVGAGGGYGAGANGGASSWSDGTNTVTGGGGGGTGAVASATGGDINLSSSSSATDLTIGSFWGSSYGKGGTGGSGVGGTAGIVVVFEFG